MKPTIARVLLTVLLPALLICAMITTGYGTADAQAPTATPTPTCPPGEIYDPVMDRCRVIKVECPAGKIDVHGNGTVCEGPDPIAPPIACLAWPQPPSLPSTGQVECALPLTLGGEPLRVGGAVGCLSITRRPYPRAMVNIPVEVRVTHIIPPAQLSGIPFGAPGSYRLSAADPWTTEGLFLHERYGFVTADSYGQPAFDTRALLAGDPYPYPSVNNVRARLIFRMDTAPDALIWTTAGFPAPSYGGLRNWTATIYPRASFPLPVSGQQPSILGPALNGANVLPAFRLALRSQWNVYLNAEWDEFTVSEAHAYEFHRHRQVEVRVTSAYASYRVWDLRQSLVNAAGIYCNASEGYLPVPVIEGQAVLR